MLRTQPEDLSHDHWSGAGGRLVLASIRRHRSKVIAIVLATIGVYASGLSVPIVVRHIIDGITAAAPTHLVLALGALAVLLSVADVWLADRRRAMIIRLGQLLDRSVSLAIMSHLLRARVGPDINRAGEILNRVEQSDKIKGFLIDLIPGAMFDIGGALIAAAIIVTYSPLCGGVILAIAVAGFLLTGHILRDYHEGVSRQFRLSSQRQGLLTETVTGLPTIRALAIEPARMRLWGDATRQLVQAEAASAHILRRFHLVTRLAQHVMTLAVLGVGGYELLAGALTTGELFAILMLVGRISLPLLNAADVARQYQEVAVAVAELGQLLASPRDGTGSSGAARTPVTGGIAFRDVSLRYGAHRPPALESVTFRLPESGLVAVIGRNGSGKSTMLRLIQAMLPDHDGVITVGGTDIRAFRPRWLRSQMAVVNQDTVLFAGTIRENVACWEKGVSEHALEAALRLAGAWDFVSRLPDGLDTRLIENGANLSGGQRQRLAVARALIRAPAIVLLDEPTAFLDVEAAVDLEERLCEWGKGRLLVLVTHHLAAARRADHILLLDDGRLAAIGSHDTLINDSDLYRALWQDYLRGSGPGDPMPNGAQPR